LIPKCFHYNPIGGIMINECKKCNDLTGKEWLQNSFSIWRNLNKTSDEKILKHPASYSVALCEKILHTFSKKGRNVLDPFDGIGTTMVATHNLKSKGTGIDLSKDFSQIARTRINNDKNINIITGDSFIELEKLKENYFDICLTSPPYWDILNMRRTADIKKNVNYSDNKKDLGNISNYKEFITLLGELFAKVHKCLKKDAYCIVNVMDIRKKSNFYPLHCDIIMELQQKGYILDDIVIWDRQTEYNNMKPLGYPYKFRINKVHEYILIFIKK